MKRGPVALLALVLLIAVTGAVTSTPSVLVLAVIIALGLLVDAWRAIEDLAQDRAARDAAELER